MRPGLAVGFVLLSLLLVPTTGAVGGWTQAGHDATRTGNAHGQGPSFPDVAMDLELPGELAVQVGGPASPLLHNGSAYLALEAIDSIHGPVSDGVVRVDLDTAGIEVLVLLPPSEDIVGIALAEDRVIIGTETAVHAHQLADGEHLWSWPAPTGPGVSNGSLLCSQPAAADGVIYYGCSRILDTFSTDTYIVALNTVGGGIAGLWQPREKVTQDPGTRPGSTILLGLSVVGGEVVASMARELVTSDFLSPGCDPGGQCATGPTNAQLAVRAFDLNLTRSVWDHTTRATSLYYDARLTEGQEGERLSGISPRVTGDANVVYVRMNDEVLALNPGAEVTSTDPEQNERVIWRQEIGDQDARTNLTLGGFALSEEGLFTTSTETLYRFNREDPEDHWRETLSRDRNELFGGGDLVLAGEMLYAAAFARDGSGSTVYAREAESGDLAWEHEVATLPGRDQAAHVASLAEGVLVIAGDDGRFQAIGTTGASIEPVVQTSDPTPPPGEPVTLDLSSTEPGAQGPATSFRVDWGDGNTTGWSPSPVFSHTYATEGPIQATVFVKNEANQTARIQQTFHVGQTEPNFVETAFQRDNQDLTFGVLGILVAVTGGAIGVARRYRERSRLQDELAAVETAYEETKDRPAECEAQLTERKTHARGLMLDGELTEEQFGVVERRIDELLRGLRMGAVEDEFDFLPYALVKKAREMLEDGKVSSLEAEAFLAAIDGDDVLTEGQKTSLRERIRVWRARDSSA